MTGVRGRVSLKRPHPRPNVGCTWHLPADLRTECRVFGAREADIIISPTPPSRHLSHAMAQHLAFREEG